MIRAGLIGLAFLVAGGAPGQAADPDRSPFDPMDCPADASTWAEQALTRITMGALGLPPVPYPADNPPSAAKIVLGRKIFFDRRLSINGTMSCAMCHVPEQAFANWELMTAVGVEGRTVKRNAPSLLNVGYLDVLFHDGRDVALETQFIGPVVNHNEMANPSAGHVVAQINELPDYAPLFDAAFGVPASLDRIGQALGSYQRSLVAGNSPFDRWHYGGDQAAVDADVKLGFALFTGKAGCNGCHLIGVEHALLTDQRFHDTSYGRMREEMRQNPPETVAVQVAPGVVHQVDFAKVRAVSLVQEGDLGRYEVTEAPADRWKFRTPGLRNVAVTGPYMHDGALRTLRDVIRFYNQGGAATQGQDPRIRPLGLGESEIAQIEAFLGSLTAPDIACLAAEARSAAPDNHGGSE